ncbi:MAG: DUF87 domain-containing protein [Lachnospiraceae bacterium]
MGDNREFLKGVVTFYIKHKIPVEIFFYEQESQSKNSFEEFFTIENIDIINEMYNNILNKYHLEEAHELVEKMKRAITFYIRKDSGSYNYAHLTFCNNNSLDDGASHSMKDIPTGLMLDGIVSGVSSLMESDYRIGFGIKDMNEASFLNEKAILLNEYAFNMVNGAKNSYTKEKSIVSVSEVIKEVRLNAMYDSSYWVTFINPKFNLSYFLKQAEELLIVHYGDQLESSDTYSAITVTKKTDLYKIIMRQYLEDNHVHVTENGIENAIKIFNSINGEWLLKLVESRNQYASRANISHIAAIKYMLSVLNHEKILWIPISMEEILRVAGTMKLQTETIFSKSDLGIEGVASDDILMIGVEKTLPNKLFFYPVEVKVTKHDKSSIDKGKEQIKKVITLYEERLAQGDSDNFSKKFYRNFFMQLLYINANKLFMNGFFSEEDYQYLLNIKKLLLNDEFEISTDLNKYLGRGAVLCFKADNSWSSFDIEEDVLILKFNKEDAFTGVVETLECIKHKIQNGKTDLDTNVLLSRCYLPKIQNLLDDKAIKVDSIEVNEKEDIQKSKAENENTMDLVKETSVYEYENQIEKVVKEHIGENKNNLDTTEKKVETGEILESLNKRVLIGTVQGTTKKLYWEFGNAKLANRHMLILGKSGQGKSYLIQCLLLELSKLQVSSLIIDYTDGFKKSQLEPVFKEALGSNLQQFLVAKDKFPLNPFKKNLKELDEDEYIEEDASDVADRVQSILDAIYGFGPQQSNCIYQAVKVGVESYGDKMTLTKLKMALEEDESTYAKTTLSRLALLFDKDPFSYGGEFDWESIENNTGNVFIIQLTSFMRDIQKVVTEFILWDLWYYRIQNGNKDKPFPIVLDEAQNLNHNGKSPSAKILTEGRKFGWSGMYATQFLKGAFEADVIKRLENSGHKVFFRAPDSEITQVAAMISKDTTERKMWENRFASLNKGQCISQGLLVDDSGVARGDIVAVVDITSLEKRV